MTATPQPSREPHSEDNNTRKTSARAEYAKRRPAFDRKHGTVTAANSTPLTDGAAVTVPCLRSNAGRSFA
ncbi:hypothetical protein QMT15_02550 [Cronobacter sakazakii]|nr:hypothetical protein [Cronobacter sakazakii]